MNNKIGIKSHITTILNLNRKSYKSLVNLFKYYEYPAPSINLVEILKNFKIKEKFLRPHSVNISICKKDGVCSNTLNNLKMEVALTKLEYLTDQKVSITSISSYSSHYYLYPPTYFNKDESETIINNSNLLREKLGVEIALENPAVYSTIANKSAIISFYEYLDKKLPKGVGWLVDISHLIVTSMDIIDGIRSRKFGRRSLVNEGVS